MRWLTLALSLLAVAPAAAQATLTEERSAVATAPPTLTEGQITIALARYQHEPPVSRVVRAALRARSASPGRVRDAMDRARATGWLPTTTGTIRRGQAVDLRALTGDDARTNVSTDDDLVLEARMTFRFDRIVFAPEEVALLRELRATEAEQAQIAGLVVRLWFERRRLQLERDLVAPADVARRVRILEIEGLLDAFTGGAFDRMMGSRGDRQTTPSTIRRRDRR